MNLAKLLEGPAIAKHRGQFFHSRTGLALTPSVATFELASDLYGPVDVRTQDSTIALALTPMGLWKDPLLDVLFRWRNAQVGQLVTPRYDVDSVDTAEDTLTLVGSSGPRKGCPIVAASFTTLPAGMVADTVYYAGVPDDESPNVITLHTTEADALAGTNLVNLTDVGTGDHAIVEQEPLTIYTQANRIITFHNAAVTAMPAVTFGSRTPLFGAATFQVFRKNNVARTAAASLFSVTKGVIPADPPTVGDAPTQAYGFGWGGAPWDAFKMRGAFTLTPALASTEVPGEDADGVVSRCITGVSATGQGAPSGFSEKQLLDVLLMQDAGAAVGASRTRADLVISGAGVYASLYNAGPRELPLTFAAGSPRAGELGFVGARTPGEAAFYVGENADA